MPKAKVRLDLTLRKTIEIEVPDNLSEKERRLFLKVALDTMYKNEEEILKLNEKNNKFRFSAKLESYPILYNLDSKEF